MSKQQWEDIYREAWSLYYTPKHMRTLLRRAAATGVPMASLVESSGDVLDDGPRREPAPVAERHPAFQASV